MTHRTGRARSAATGAAALLAVCLGITTVQAQEPDDAATPDAPEAELPPAETPAPDVPPTEVTYVPREWEQHHRPNMTGTPRAYRPKGSILSTGQRPDATGDYKAWTPGS